MVTARQRPPTISEGEMEYTPSYNMAEMYND